MDIGTDESPNGVIAGNRTKHRMTVCQQTQAETGEGRRISMTVPHQLQVLMVWCHQTIITMGKSRMTQRAFPP